MKPLVEAIYTLFTTAPYSDLYNAVGGRLYLGEALQSTAYPYVVFKVVADNPEKYFGDTVIEDILIQFSLYSRNTSAVEVNDLFTYLKTLFDDCALTVTGYTHVSMARQDANLLRDAENNLWHYAVDYEVRIY